MSPLADLLYPLALLACPIGMGLMMFVMMRGNRHERPPSDSTSDEFTRLRAEVDQLRAAQKQPSSDGTPADSRRQR